MTRTERTATYAGPADAFPGLGSWALYGQGLCLRCAEAEFIGGGLFGEFDEFDVVFLQYFQDLVRGDTEEFAAEVDLVDALLSERPVQHCLGGEGIVGVKESMYVESEGYGRISEFVAR